MFSKCVKHYHQWLRSAILFKAKLDQISSDSIRVQGPTKRPSFGHLHPVSLVKERHRKGGKCKISRVLQSPVPSTQASPKVEASNRLKQAQHFSTCRKVQNGNPGVHQDFPGPRGVGIVDRPVRRIPSHPHPSKLKEVPKVLLQGPGVPVHLPTFRTGHSPPGLYDDRKGSETNGPLKRTHQYLDDWLIRSQSQEESQRDTQAVVDLTQSLGWIINQEKSELKPTQVFSFVGYEYHLDSALVRPTHERWLKLQDLILLLKSKRVLTARCLMPLIGLLASTEKMVSEGRLHMRPFQFHLKEHWRYPHSLDNLLPWTEAIVGHLDWWQNPSNVMKGADLHPKDHSIQLFTDASNEGWGAHIDQNSTKGLWSEREKRLHVNVLELKAVSLALRDFKDQCQNQTVLVATDNSTLVHQQAGGNSLSRDVRSPVENHDLVPSLPYNIESQAHSRVSECDGRPPIQVQPSAVNRMVSAPSGLQANLPEVVHPSCRLIRHSPHHKLPLYVSPIPDPRAWNIDALNINWTNLTAYAYPPTALPLHKVIQKIKQCHCLIIMIAPGWPGMPWFWDLVQLSTEIPLQLPVSTTLLKQSHNYVFHNNPQQLNLHAWCLGADNSKNKASLWRWQRELLPLSGHQQGPSTGQSGPYLKNGAEKIRWISPLHL